jgi:uncharacterized protein YdeI (YjbR/CyaY-like superfamily)
MIELDAGKRTVKVPLYLAKALGKRLRAVFDSMSYTLRKEYVMHVDDAKKLETRKRRIGNVLDALHKRGQAQLAHVSL